MCQFNEEIQKSKLIYTNPITLAWTNEKLETVMPRRWENVFVSFPLRKPVRRERGKLRFQVFYTHVDDSSYDEKNIIFITD